MKKMLLIALAFVLTVPLFAQRTCETMEVLQQMEREDPLLKQRMNDIEEFTQNYIQNLGQNQLDVTGVITIPVVVHVVYRTAAENISAAQVQSQIDVLNKDFARLNADAANTPSLFLGVAANTEIQFCLATTDPSGAATTGITRTATTKTSFGTNNSVKYAAQGGKDAWPSGSYLNLWVCNISGSTISILGYAQFPGGAAATDGVVIDYRCMGTNGTAAAPFHLGRTATHEVGHWLNLRHIWGDGGCSVDDFVGDTPLAGAANYTGSPCTFPGPNTCGSKGPNSANDLPDMFQNYMDYSDDVCMNLFTLGQKSRMRALFDAGGARVALLSSTGCGGTPPAATCFDGIQNQGETGVDCGGPCAACPPPGTCGAPTGLTSTPKKGGSEAALAWTAVAGASSYTVGLKAASATTYNTGTTTGTTITATGLTKNTTYNWYVQANCGTNGLSTQTFGTFIAGQSARVTALSNILLYPNPANNLATLAFYSDDASAVTLLIADVTGRLVKYEQFNAAVGNNEAEIDLHNLASGVYVISLEMNGESINLRLIKE